MRRASHSWLLLAVVVVGLSAASVFTGPGVSSTVVWRRYVAARASPCDRVGSGLLSYHYPVKPFAVQHPVRGSFGDPRTIVRRPFGNDNPHSSGSFTFHNGVDIAAPTGTRVYPVVSGVARVGSADEVVVGTADGRKFQYFHIHPAVHTGERVTAYRTVLGRILPEWHHVHLSEIDVFRVHNPTDPGHLTPYHDRTIPVVEKVDFLTRAQRPLDPSALQGKIDVVARAADMPPVPVPGAWFGFPLAPAVVSWQLTRRGRGVVVRWTTIADFRHTLPPNRDFWRVYAPGCSRTSPSLATTTSSDCPAAIASTSPHTASIRATSQTEPISSAYVSPTYAPTEACSTRPSQFVTIRRRLLSQQPWCLTLPWRPQSPHTDL